MACTKDEEVDGEVKNEKLVGTTGKYYSELGFEFAQVYMNAWVHFYLYDYPNSIFPSLSILNTLKL